MLLQGGAGVGKSRLLDQMKWTAQLTGTVVEGSPLAVRSVRELCRRAAGRDDLPGGVAGVLEAHAAINAQDEGIVVCLDDADRLDPEDLQSFQALIRCVQPDDRLLLLAATTAPLELESPALERVAVEPLDVANVADWAASLVSPNRIAELHAFSAGVPARIEATLGQIHRGVRTETDLCSEVRGARQRGVEPAVPRIDRPSGLARLDEAGREAVALLAALGGLVDVDRFEELLPSAQAVELAAVGWIRRDGGRWRLAAVDPAEVVAELPPRLIREAHERIVRALQSPAPSAPQRPGAQRTVPLPGDAAELLLHMTAAGRLAEAESLLLDTEPSLLGARRGSTCVFELGRQSRRADVLLRVAEIHHRAERPALSLAVLARLVRIEPGRRRDTACCHLAGSCYHALGRSRRARRYLERALTELPAGEAGGRLRGQVVALLARVSLQRGDYARARSLAHAELESCRSPALRASLLQSAGVAASYLGEVDQALDHLRTAATLQEQTGAAAERLRTLSYVAIAEYRRGNLEAAIEGYRAAIDVAEGHGLTPLLASALLNLGTACQRQGDWGAALGNYERGLRLARALGRASTEATLQLNLANLYVEIGSFDRGLASLERVEPLARSAGLTHLEGMTRVIRGEVALARGETLAAIAEFDGARRFHEERGDEREVAEALLHAAEALLARGEIPEAAERVAAATRRAAELDATDLAAQLAWFEGRCAWARGAADEALAQLDESRELCQQSSQQLLEADVLAARSQVALARGDDRRARDDREQARSRWRRVAETLPPALRDAFWAHPRRAALVDTATHQFPPALSGAEPSTLDRRVLTRFLEVNQRINSSLSIERVLEFAMDAAIELTGAERGFVLLGPAGEKPSSRSADPREGYEVAVARNLDRTRLSDEEYEFSTHIAERVLDTGQPIITVDARRDERFSGHRSVHAMQLQSVAAVPIRSRRGVAGALYLDNRYQRGHFTPADLDLLVAFADQVAIALRNARIHGALERRARDLEVDKRAAEQRSRGQAKEIARLSREVQTRQRALELRYDYQQIVGRSGPMRSLLATLDRVIDSPLSVLVQGESGTGKELIARAIHFNSPRRAKPFLSINCAALPEALLESELFGHVRGAFTGAAADKEGLMVAARGGTLLLDEVGDMPAPMQVKLLRALQEREVRPVGATAVRQIDLRVLAATNKDLEAEVRSGSFREDLYYRLAVVTVQVPALRERPEDIAALATTFLGRLAEQSSAPAPELSRAALRLLMHYRWPGNVRQLENVLAKAFYLSDRTLIDVADVELPRRLRSPSRARDRRSFERDEARRILDALHQHRWNVSAVARSLGIPRNTLYRKLRKLQIQRPDHEPSGERRAPARPPG
jgi:transcriptional regulator with GAF, ATPase, and Fis domain